MVKDSILECPKCGRGVFESEKFHRESQSIEREATPIPESESKRSWLDTLFGRRKKKTLADLAQQYPDIGKALDVSMGRVQPATDVHHHVIYDNKDKTVTEFVRTATQHQFLIGGNTRYLPKNHSSIYYGESVGAIEHCIVGENEILNCNISYISSIINEMLSDAKHFKRIIRLLGIIIHGYDEDPRPLWEVPQVKAWYKVLHGTFPYLLYWLHPQDVVIYTYMFGQTHRVEGEKSAIEGPSIAGFIQSVWDVGNRFCYQIAQGDKQSAQVMISEAVERINRALLGKHAP